MVVPSFEEQTSQSWLKVAKQDSNLLERDFATSLIETEAPNFEQHAASNFWSGSRSDTHFLTH